jgi:hypothetical protein
LWANHSIKVKKLSNDLRENPKSGSFLRKPDGRRLKRFCYKQCRLSFSEATGQTNERGPAREKLFSNVSSLIYMKKILDFNTAAGPQAFGDSVVSKRHREQAEANLRGSGSSSAWCSAHNGSAAAGRMFEDPEPLRFGSTKCPWSLEQQSSGPFYDYLIVPGRGRPA